MTSPMTSIVAPTPPVPALALRFWPDSDVPAFVAVHCEEAMCRWLMRPIEDEADEARARLAELDTGWVGRLSAELGCRRGQHARRRGDARLSRTPRRPA